MFQNQASSSYPLNHSVGSLNYYQQQMSSVSCANLGDPSWLGWPMWIATDVIVTVGDRQFHAHRSVLIANSGYFRSELSSSNSILPDKQVTKPTVITPGWGACVGTKIFSVLLDFMYTSRLPLDSANVLEVLSAAQILMMPRVIELCRGYLIQRHLTGCLSDFYSINRNYPPPPPPPPPTHFNLGLNAPENVSAFFPTCSVDRGVHNYLNINRPSDPYCASSSGGPHRIIRPIPSKFPFSVIPSTTTTANQIASTTTAAHPTSPAPKTSEVSQEKSQTPPLSKIEEPFAADGSLAEKTVDANSGQASDDTATLPNSGTQIKEYIDVACCDGPVKFQRVLNQNCSLVIMMMSNDNDKPLKKRREVETTKQSDVQEVKKPMENKDDASPPNVGPEPPTKPTGKRVHYRCVYCRHTYKSLCCYLKHKQRHLNPKSKLGFKIGGEGGSVEEKGSAEKVDRKDSESGNSQEINVPFYPCRVCGLKFPSYYFVHKHRRACHKMTQSDSSD